jgi:branched-chain amino acid transport system permease protein
MSLHAGSRRYLGWTPKVALVLVLVVLLLASVPWWVSSSILFRVGAGLTAGLLALSLNLVFGYTGMISFGHAALFALGGYSAGIALRAGHPWLLALLIGLAVGVLAGFVFGSIALRASGIYFDVLTLAMGEIVYRVLLQWTDVTGGENGLPGIRAGSLLGLDLNRATTYYYFLLTMFIAAVLLMRVLTLSRFGRTLRAIRSNPERARYLGVPVRRHQLASFCISAAFAAFAGVLYGPWSGLLTPALARWDHSAQPILATLLGGSANFLGPLIGAGVFEVLSYATRGLRSLRIVATGVILLVVILLVPGGLTNLFERLRRRKTDARHETDAAEADRAKEEVR